MPPEKRPGGGRIVSLAALSLFIFALSTLTGYGIVRYLGPGAEIDEQRAESTDGRKTTPDEVSSGASQGKVEPRKEEKSSSTGSIKPLTNDEPTQPSSKEPAVTLPDPELIQPPTLLADAVPPPKTEEPKPEPPPVVKVPPSVKPESGTGGETTRPVVVKRRKEMSDEDLRKQLLSVTEVGLDQTAAAVLYTPLIQFMRSGKTPSLGHDHGLRFLAEVARTQKRPDATRFPWRLGADCQLGKEAADTLHVLSRNLRSCLQASTPHGDIRPDAEQLRELLLTGRSSQRGGVRFRGTANADIKPSEWRQSRAIPAMLQLLQHENGPIRLLLVDLLAQIDGKEASVALAQRSVFDLSPQVREKAIHALSRRPSSDYQQVFLESLRYTWPGVADHAAEALAALKSRDTVPLLIDLLKAPDPTLPFREKDKETLAVRELVRINHLSNCMLCHSPSSSREDLVRGRIPIPGEDPPPLYYAEPTGLFVRADVTFLRQDFSVVQPVLNSGKWPGNQRYDYLVRTRPPTKTEVNRFEESQKPNATADRYEQRDAVLFAVRELTEKDLGTSYEDWKPLRETWQAKEQSPDKKQERERP